MSQEEIKWWVNGQNELQAVTQWSNSGQNCDAQSQIRSSPYSK